MRNLSKEIFFADLPVSFILNCKNGYINLPLVKSILYDREHTNYMRIISFTLAILFFPVLLLSQEASEFITIDQGLSQNYIYSICQDKKGFLWIGTKDGLNRYDGNEFVCYRHNPADSTTLSENNVSIVFEDSHHRLWVGTNGGGLNLYDRTKESFVQIKSSADRTTLSSNYITCIFESRDGFIWVGTTDGGFNKLNPATFAAQRFVHQATNSNSVSSNYIHAISESDDGLLWIATAQGGLNCYNPKSKLFSHILPKDKDGLEVKYSNDVTSLYVNKNGMVWFGTASGLNLYDTHTGTIQYYPVRDSNGKPCLISNILKVNNTLYISSFQIFAAFDLQNKKYTVLSEPADKWFTNAVCKDKSGIFWLGTGGWGVMKYNPNTKMFHSTPGVFLNEAFPTAVNAFRKYSGSLSSALLNGRGTEFLPIKKTKAGEYFIATPRTGLFRIDKTDKLIERINTNPSNVPAVPVWAVSGVFEDNLGTIWLTTVGGINRYNTDTKTFTHFRLYDDKKVSSEYLNKSGAAGYSDISATLVDHDNVFWLGTPDRGLIRYDPQKNLTTVYHQEPRDNFSLSNNHILSILEDLQNPDMYLWIGTEGGGLNHFEKATGKCEHITTDNGLPNNVVYGILTDDDGSLWMSTNKGLCRYNPESKLFKNYDVESGLQSNEFNRREYYKAPDGKMYFGGILGYNAFYPKNIRTNNNTPQIVLTGFKLFNKRVSFKDESSPLKQSIETTEKIILEYAQNVISLEYAALEYSMPKHNMYEYKLEGFNKDWVSAGTVREATFTNLNPGTYRFRVRGANSDGIWGKSEAVVDIIVMPPFYMTWWFKATVILIALGIVIAVIRFLIMRRVRERIMKSEHEAAMERERLRIARDLHDEIGSRLTEIRLVSEMAKQKNISSNDIFEKLEEISSASENVVTTFSEIVWSLNPKNDSLENVASFLGQISTEFLSKAGIRCRLDFPPELPGYNIPSEARHNIILAVKELMNNIVKHSGASIATIELSTDEKDLSIIVKDNGCGFGMSNVRTFGNGLKNIQRRIESIGGNVTMESIIDKGTTTKINLPLKSFQIP
ncbi:MAG: two-component regulator propeller domain-containing protein [Melioribacteraceae bacterium]